MAIRDQLNHEVRKVDNAGRLSLGRGKAGEHYDVTEDADGRIVLTPVAVIPKRELWLYQNSEAMAMVQQGLAESARGEATYVGSFAQYADDPLDEE